MEDKKEEIEKEEIESENIENKESIDSAEEMRKMRRKTDIKYMVIAIFREIAEWVICFIVAYVIYLVLNYFVGTISGVKQVSMLPTAKEGERLLIQRPTILKKELKHGDIITFEAPKEDNIYDKEDDGSVTASYEEYKGVDSFLYNFVGIGKMTYIKRVIGLPGDHIVIGDDGFVYRNSERLNEEYIKDGYTNQMGDFIDLIVPEGTVFAMGDNRLESKDSRYFGCVPMEKINGYVLCRIWPLNKLGKL